MDKLTLKLRGLRVRGHSDTWEEIPGTIHDFDGTNNQDEEDGWPKLFNVKTKKSNKNDFQLGLQSFTHIVLFIVIGLSLLFVKHFDGKLPKSLTTADLQNDTMQFIEERARNDLIELTKVGVRISGSYVTDIVTVNKIMDILTNINKTIRPELNFEFEVQRSSGAFFMDSDEGHTSVYSQIANVVAKLELNNPMARSNDSVLFNCHFDSKPSSPGATDNMISCVTMLETLRILTTTSADETFTNTLVFLFNGAEELGLQGAHAFVKGDNGKGHRWSQSLKSFVNLEGAGAGGREILFQTGPGDGWILKAYRQVAPHPYGLVVGEEAFQLGLIPSDTDFRIFRDFKDIPGLDMAFVKNGYFYHTKLDTVTAIPPGSIQNMGDNALELAKYFSTLNFQDVDTGSGDKMVFFDIFGLFMVSYSETVGIIINMSIAVLFILITIFEVKPKVSSIKVFLWLFFSTIISWGAGIAASVFAGAFFNWTGYYKPFYSYPSFAFILFGIPAILSSTLIFSFAWRGSQKKTWFASKFTTAILLACLTFVTRIVYILTLNLVFAIISWILRRFVFTRFKLPKVELVTTLLVGELIPFLFSAYMTLTLVDVFVPIMGRTGTETNPNIFLGMILGTIICILVFNGLHSYLVNCQKIYLIIGLVLTIFIVNPLVVFGFIGKIPFQEKTPMRVRILDVDRTWFNPSNGLNSFEVNRTDSGYWFWPVDPNTIDFFPEFIKTMPKLADYDEIDANINSCSDLYCNQLFLWPTTESIKKTPWVPTGIGLPSSIKDFTMMQVLKNEPLTADKRRVLDLQFRGLPSCSQMTIVLSPTANYELFSWDVGGGLEIPSSGDIEFNDRPTYLIYVGNGYGVSTMNISLTFQVQQDQESVGDPVVHVMYVGHYMHDQTVQRPAFQEIVKEFPSWTNVMSWASVLNQYTILAN